MTAPSLAYQDAMNGIAILYDALSNAENELDKLKNTWIKCSEQMPLDNVPVLVWKVSKFNPKYETCGIAPCIDGEFDLLAANDFIVTHWQPLPAPPKDK